MEGQTESTPAAEVKPATPPAATAPTVDIEAIKREATEAAKQFAIQSQKEQEKRFAEQQAAERQRIADAVLGTKPSADPNAQALLQLLIETKESAKAEMRAEQEEKEAEARERATAVNAVVKDRPDITSDKDAMLIVRSYLEQQDESIPLKERMVNAVKEYDLFSERKGLGSAQERIAKASSISTTSASQTPNQSAEKTEQQILDEERAEVAALVKAQRKGW